MEAFIRSVLKQVYSNLQIDRDALNRVVIISEAIRITQQNLEISEWLKIVPGELGKNMTLEATTSPIEAPTKILNHLLSKILKPKNFC